MSISSKKMEMADKMYDQNSKGKGHLSMKYTMQGKETKPNARGQKFEMIGKNTGYAKGQKYSQSDKNGSFKDKYHQADPEGSMKGGYKM